MENLLALNNCSKNYCEVCIEVKPQNPWRKRKSTIEKLFLMLCSVSTIGSFCSRTSDGFISLTTPSTKGIFASYHRGVSIKRYERPHGETPVNNLFLRIFHAAVMWKGLFTCGNVVTSTINLPGQGLQLLSIPCPYVLLIQYCM